MLAQWYNDGGRRGEEGRWHFSVVGLDGAPWSAIGDKVERTSWWLANKKMSGE